MKTKKMHLRVFNHHLASATVCGGDPAKLPSDEFCIVCDTAGNIHASVLLKTIGDPATNCLVSPSGALYERCVPCFTGAGK